ncbi:hypothetical protein Tco_1479284, partial [Tanacetum coccineum]
KCDMKSEKCDMKSEKCDIKSKKCDMKSEKCDTKGSKVLSFDLVKRDKVCTSCIELNSNKTGMLPKVSIWEGVEEKEPTSWEGVKTQLDTAQEVQSIIYIKAKKFKKMKLLQDMQLIQKLRDDQKCIKKVVKDMSSSYE